jgi:ankyrin repeat protein
MTHVRTPLHVVTDWPGYFPNGPRVAQLLIDAGADVNDRGTDGDKGEAPLHWAASSDDVDVAAVLIDGGADIEMPNGSIGTPLDNAIGYVLLERRPSCLLTNRWRLRRKSTKPSGTPVPGANVALQSYCLIGAPR